jgi:hypothetical protein
MRCGVSGWRCRRAHSNSIAPHGRRWLGFQGCDSMGFLTRPAAMEFRNSGREFPRPKFALRIMQNPCAPAACENASWKRTGHTAEGSERFECLGFSRNRPPTRSEIEPNHTEPRRRKLPLWTLSARSKRQKSPVMLANSGIASANFGLEVRLRAALPRPSRQEKHRTKGDCSGALPTVARRMLVPSSFRCSSRHHPNHSPLGQPSH